MSPTYQRLLFVCLNDRGDGHPKGSCSQAGGAELLDALRAECHERGLKGVVRAVGTRCLGQCAHGPVVTIQPEDVWYGGVQASDVSSLLDQHVLQGRPVEHLEIHPEKLTGKSATDHALPPFDRDVNS